MSDQALRTKSVPIGSFGRRATGWIGVWTLVATEGALFAYLIFSYFYFAAQSLTDWPPGGPPPLKLAGPNTIILILSSMALIWAERSGARRAARGRLLAGILVAFILGCAFAGIQVLEWRSKTFSLTSGPYGSVYFTLTGFHLAHVVAGLVVLLCLLIWAALGYFGRERHAPLTIGAIYWHFVDVVWIFVFVTIYGSPYLG